MTSRVDFWRLHRRHRGGRWRALFIASLLATCVDAGLAADRDVGELEQASLTAGLGQDRRIQEPLVVEGPVQLGENDDVLRAVGDDARKEEARKMALDLESPVNPLEELHHALETMQNHYFELWLGTWPTAIDWTAAVMGTHVSSSLNSLTRSLEYALPGTMSHDADGARVENEINKYFSQAVAYYFGENAFAIRNQAFDDMLWVVLGWLETIKFINLHDKRHYPVTKDSMGDGAWYGKQFEPGFAHRARIFYDLASRGWDTRLCGGGMNWSPHLEPYKNAITNELFIAASIGMYLYFPGDDNMAPFSAADGSFHTRLDAEPHNRKYLDAAIAGYDWLAASNMTNKQGLYVDGFHIHGYGRNNTIGTGKCDVRNEMVYTYNQGVLLSGLRGLWEGTGRTRYLEDGHALVRNVIAATGWVSDRPNGSWRWAGLGRNGILEEICDSSGTCSQNGQTFKGIFFHHLTLFCQPLPRTPLVPGKTHAATPVVAMLHAQSCKEYAAWVAHNARNALKTRDEKGKFGTWWGWPPFGGMSSPPPAPLPDGAVDYRNEGASVGAAEWTDMPRTNDLNDRGRGRTVETQGGGVAVLRAMWELVSMYKYD